MATSIDMTNLPASAGPNSGTPLTSSPIGVAAGVEEVISFTNWDKVPKDLNLVLVTDGADVTYGYATGQTGGKLISNQYSYIEHLGGRTLYVNSTAGANLWLRVL